MFMFVVILTKVRLGENAVNHYLKPYITHVKMYEINHGRVTLKHSMAKPYIPPLC